MQQTATLVYQSALFQVLHKSEMTALKSISGVFISVCVSMTLCSFHSIIENRKRKDIYFDFYAIFLEESGFLKNK
jgi:hypothetical protein